MKYKVENLTKTPEGWKGELVSWEGCYCSRTSESFLINQEKQPSKAEITSFLYGS